MTLLNLVWITRNATPIVVRRAARTQVPVDTTLCSSDADCNVGVTCSRDCAVDTFRGLSHFDVTFPELGGVGSCLGAGKCVGGNNAGANCTVASDCDSGQCGTSVSGTCACTNTSSTSCAVDANVVLGDGSCFGDQPSNGQGFVAKCDNTNLLPGDCITMTLTIAGELNGLGLGAAVVVDKEATNCTASCIAGPSCEPCEEEENGSACLTRTIGFWGTHPWITNNYDPVTVCGKTIGCNDLSNDTSACSAGTCTSIIEGLCSNPGQELPTNQPYVSLVRQLTAAKLNLNASASLFEGAQGSSFCWDNINKEQVECTGGDSLTTTNGGTIETIQQVITRCESLCGANKSTISNSGCIEALNAFNNSEDTGFDVTPAPFDRPSVDDNGNVKGASPTQCNLAHGNTGSLKLVIGKNLGSKGANCQ